MTPANKLAAVAPRTRGQERRAEAGNRLPFVSQEARCRVRGGIMRADDVA